MNDHCGKEQDFSKRKFIHDLHNHHVKLILSAPTIQRVNSLIFLNIKHYVRIVRLMKQLKGVFESMKLVVLTRGLNNVMNSLSAFFFFFVKSEILETIHLVFKICR